MARPQVSIRLSTDGKAQVERDFGDIATSGDAAAKRIASSFERDAAAAEALLNKLAKTQERLAAVSATPLQQTINSSVGIGPDQSGTARASAQALAQQLEQAEREARQLIASIDPLFAAQARYEAQVERINAVKATGQIDEARYQQLLAAETVELERATVAAAKHAGQSGQMRMGMQQLGFQLNDVATQFASGTKASVIFAQQSGQVIQAFQLMGGEGNAFLEFLRGPWGIGLTVAAIALTPLIGKLFETGQTVDDVVEKLKKEATQAQVTDQAHKVFATTLDGVTEAARKNREALKGLADAGQTAAERALEDARAQLAQLQVIDATTRAMINQTRALVEHRRAEAEGHPNDPDYYGFGDLANAANQRLDALEKSLPVIQAKLKEFNQDLAEAASRVAVESATRGAEERIKRTYEGPNGLIEQTRKRLVNEKATTAEIEKQVRALADRERGEIKAAQDADRPAGTNAGGTAIFNDQVGRFFDIAMQYRGRSEHSAGDRGALESFFREANLQLDPEKTAWCAAFVNAVLAAGGVKGNGSLAARSFLTYGKDDTSSPQKGDIVVVGKGGQDHVGFLQSIDAKGNVQVFGGNTADKVGTARYSASQVLGIRRPPTPSESAESDEKDAEQAQRAQEEAYARNGRAIMETVDKAAREADEAERKLTEDIKRRADAYQNVVNQQQDSRTLLEAEVGMAGMSTEQRTRALDILRQELDLQHQLGPEYAERIKQIGQEAQAQEDLRRHLDQIEAGYDELRQTGEQVIDDLFNPSNWNNWGDLGKRILHELEAEFIKLAEINPLKNLLNGGATLPTLSSLAGLFGGGLSAATQLSASAALPVNIQSSSLFTGTSFPTFMGLGHANGTEYSDGGLAWVGEYGKELVQLPRGSKVTPASESRRIAGANDAPPTINFHIPIDATGADTAAIARLNAQLAQLQASIPSMVVTAWLDARQRNRFG